MAIAYVIAALAVSVAHYAAFWVPWHSILLFAVLVAPVAWASPKSRWAVGVYIPAILLVQLLKGSIPVDYLWVSFAGYWSLFCFVIYRLGSSAVLTSLFIMSSFPYFMGRMMGAEFSAESTGFPYLLASNVFAIIAILVAGMQGANHIRNTSSSYRHSGSSWMGFYFGRNYRASGDYPLSKMDTPPKVGGSHERR